MRNLLMIAYHFPPEASSGVYRTLGFSRCLPSLGWRPLIVTLKAHRYEPISPQDETLLARIPAAVKVFRTGILRILPLLSRLRGRKGKIRKAADSTGQIEPPQPDFLHGEGTFQRLKNALVALMSTPDRQVGWLPVACWKALRVAHEHPIQAIYTTGGPWTAHLIGLVLHPLLGKPWIADFRDPWSQNQWMPARSWLRKHWELFLESRVIHSATRVVANTSALRENFVRRYPRLSGDRFVTITNGYEPDLERTPVTSGKSNDGPMTLTHAGALYYQRDPRLFLTTIGQLVRNGDIKADQIRLNFVGENLIPGLQDGHFIKNQGLQEAVTFLPRISRQRCLQIEESSHVLVLIQPETRLQVPAKLYEYLMLGKPILALTSVGATADLMRSEGLGWVVDMNDSDQIRSAVLELYQRFQEDRLAANYDPHIRMKFRYDRLTERLTQVLEHVVGTRGVVSERHDRVE